MVEKAAVLLSGAGYLDGAEIHESVLSYLALAERNISYHSFALPKDQAQVTCHLTKMPQKDQARNMLCEAARIARGDISPLAELKVDDYDILWIPGGYGVAANLSTFAEKNTHCTVDPEVARVITQFYEAKKPIVALCIAPALVAKVLEGKGIRLTFGTDPHMAEKLEQMGQVSVFCEVSDICVDQEHLIYSAPAYMQPPNIVGIFHSLQKIARLL